MFNIRKDLKLDPKTVSTGKGKLSLVEKFVTSESAEGCWIFRILQDSETGEMVIDHRYFYYSGSNAKPSKEGTMVKLQTLRRLSKLAEQYIPE